jgi:hypothetical protein
MKQDPKDTIRKDHEKRGSRFSALMKDGTADGAAGFGIAGGIMIAAAVIWTISSRRNGNSSYGMYSLLCLGIGVYCLANMVRIIRKDREKGKGK